MASALLDLTANLQMLSDAATEGDSVVDAPVRKTAPEKSEKRTYRRAYKACESCRSKKSKCVIPEDGSPPCTRCRRELRKCIVSEERPWAKRQKTDLRREVEEQDKASDEAPIQSSMGPVQSSQREDGGHQLDLDGFRPPTAQSSTFPDSTNSFNAAVDSFSREASLSASIRGHAAFADHQRLPHSHDNALAASVMRTVVSSGNDALNLLFEAASHSEAGLNRDTATFPPSIQSPHAQTPSQSSVTSRMNGVELGGQIAHDLLPTPEVDASRVWNACRFVKMGWLSASEAVGLIDLFYANLAPLSPILTNYYSKHCNHYYLVAHDPLLACTLLMISSRYHDFPGMGGATRAQYLHQRLWDHCQHLMMRLMLGQEKRSKAKLRTIGSIEALLLMTEWHPRALHFPPAGDGWDSDLLLSSEDVRDHGAAGVAPSPSDRWLEDIVEPARRSDSMSWMLLGMALSLGHELSLFNPTTSDDSTRNESSNIQLKPQSLAHRIRTVKLLFVFVDQLAARLGHTSMVAPSLSRMVPIVRAPIISIKDMWDLSMTAWIELTRLAKTVSDMLYSSKASTQQLLQSGRYVGLIHNIQNQLSHWNERFLHPERLSGQYYDMLSIELQHVRIYANALGMQAAVDRSLGQSDISDVQNLSFELDQTDYDFVQEVMDGSCKIMQTVTKLAEAGRLRYAPVRIFLRVVCSGVYLLKGISLGVSASDLDRCLGILDRAIVSLKTNMLDDMHLASRYAQLLEMHVSMLRKNLITSSRPRGLYTRPPSRSRVGGQPNMVGTTSASKSHPQNGVDLQGENFDTLLVDSDWLALPFDPSIAPFPYDSTQDGTQAFPLIDDGTLDFLWNLPTA